MNCGIYILLNTVSGKIYVGSSRGIKKRKYTHFYLLKRREHKNPHLQSAYDKYGKSVFHFEILEYCSPSILEEREDWWIDFFDSRNPVKGYNLKTAESRSHSEETKAKISSANKGRIISEEWKAKLSSNHRGMTGKNMSEEAKEKISIANKGKSFSDEHKRKLSVARKKRVITQETKDKMSLSMKGKTHTEETKQRMREARKRVDGS